MTKYNTLTIKTQDCRSRFESRCRVVSVFLKEQPGTGTGEKVSRYKYIVETLKDGTEIYLTRPTSQGWQKLRGFDFRIDVPGVVFHKGRTSYTPRFEDVGTDLKNKRKENPGNSRILLEAIQRVYNCEDSQAIMADYSNLFFKEPYLNPRP